MYTELKYVLNILESKPDDEVLTVEELKSIINEALDLQAMHKEMLDKIDNLKDE